MGDKMKKRYVVPELRVYGDVEKLTEAKDHNGNDGHSSPKMKSM
jgi:hypothetical protein